MTIVNGYATLAELKDHLSETGSDFDTKLEKIIEGVSRAIDGIKGISFFTTSGEKRLQAHFSDQLRVPPCVSISEIVTDSAGDRSYATTLTADTHYETEGSPIHTVYITPGSGKSFPLGRGDVKVTALWGYSATVPKQIKQACLLASARQFRRKDAVFGTVGGGVVGESSIETHLRQDVDFMMFMNSINYAEVY